MNCNPSSLIAAAACYRCIPPAVMRPTMISLLCQWANHITPGPQVTWTPDTAVAFWIDGGGAHNGDLATFNATADYSTVAVLTLTGTGIIGIGNLDLLTSLATLNVDQNGLTSLNVSGHPTLSTIDCGDNALGSGAGVLNISGCPSLVNVYCDNNQLTAANFLYGGFGTYVQFDCHVNFLNALDVSGNVGLTYLDCSFNQLGALNITGDVNIVTYLTNNNPALVVTGP